jgi:hypothetical protein
MVLVHFTDRILTDRILTDENFDRQNFYRQNFEPREFLPTEFRPTRILTDRIFTDRIFTEYGILLNANSFPIILNQSSFENQGKFPGKTHFCISILSFFSRNLPDFPGIFLDQNYLHIL